MRRSFVTCLGAALAAAGCYDFDKIHNPCFDDPPGADCESDGTGVGGDGVGGTSGSGAAGGVGDTGGASTGASGSGGSPGGGGSGGTSAGGSGAGGSSAGGTGSGGTGAGGSGGSMSLAERVQRLRFNEACSGQKAVELYNIGPGSIDLTGLFFSATNGDYSFATDVALSGSVGSGEFVIIADSAADCPGGFPRCFTSPDFAASTFSNSRANGYVSDGSDEELVGSFDQGGGQNPLAGQCWLLKPDGTGTVTAGAESLGSPN